MHPYLDPALSYAVTLLFLSGHIMMYGEINMGCIVALTMDEDGCAVYFKLLSTKQASDLQLSMNCNM